jgi:hypothetical protein
MEWQTIINIGAGSSLAMLGWFARQIWDSVQDLKNDVKQIEIDLPTHYVKKDEINTRFDRMELLLDKIFEKLEQKADR